MHVSDQAVEIPRTREGLRVVVAELLDDPDIAVRDDDDLFRLGIDSIAVMRLVARWRGSGVDIGFRDLVESRTLRQWHDLLSAAAPHPVDGRTAATAADHGRAVSDPFPLATMQHAYWVGRADGQELGGVGSHFYFEFDGRQVDPRRLETAVRNLVRRHEMLRSRCTADGHQQVLAESPWPGLRVHDLTGADRAETDEALERVRSTLSHRRLDVERGEVFDVQVSQLPDGTSRVHFQIEMIVSDARSFQNMLADLAAFYENPEAPPAELGYSFRRYLADKHQRRQEARERAREHWQKRLADMPPPPALPLLPSAEVGERLVGRRFRWLPPVQREVLSARAREHGVTLSAVFLTAFADVLAAWSGQSRVLVNLPVYDREPTHPDVPELVGDFTNLVLVGVDLADDLPFAERARCVQERMYADVAHAEHSGVDVLRDLARLHPDRPQLAPVVFTTALSLGDLFDERVRRCFGDPGWTTSQTPQVCLDCQVTERSGGLYVNWDVVEELFPPGVVDAMFGAFSGLVDRLVRADWHGSCDRLLPEQQAKAREAANASGPPAGGLLHEGFFAWATWRPERTALVWGESDRLSYGEVADWALRIAGMLVGRGLGRGERVGVSLPKGPSQIAAVLGVVAAGGAYVPVGAEQPLPRRERVFRDAGVRFVLGDPAEEGPAGVAVVDVEAAGWAPLDAPVEIADDAVAYVIYTSGSTGSPKGVVVSHANAMNTVVAVNALFSIDRDDRVLAVSALDFDLSVFDVFGLLSVGGSLALVSEEERRDAAAWDRLVRRHGATVWNSVPALLDLLLMAAGEHPLPRLRLALVSGDWVGLDLPGRFATTAGEGARFAALGGATEAGIWSNYFEVDAVPPQWRSIPYGNPLPGQCFRVVDERGRDCPDWVAGELWIGGASVAQGYWGDEVRTAQRFVERDGMRWYKTGDLGRYWPDGTLEFLGRRDFQVQLRGHRVELGEVETVLETDSAVARAVVDVVGGGHVQQLVAAIVARPAQDRRQGDPTARLVELTESQLPAYMVPERFVELETLPLTPNGKVDRARLRELLASRADGSGRPGEPPRGPVETALAALWEELLEHPGPSRDDDFFALGGDSLVATKLLTRLTQAGIEGGSLTGLFNAATLCEFAAQLRFGAPSAPSALAADPEHRYEPFPSTDVQRAYWIGRTSELVLGNVGSHWYWEFDGAGVDVARLEEAFNRLIRRHEMLRAVFDDNGMQRILCEVPRFVIPVVDAGDDHEARLAALRDEMSHRIPDPGRWPVVEIRAVRYGKDRTRLAFSFDYIVLDALSVIIVFGELAALYEDLDRELPSVEVSFRDYVLHAAAAEEELEQAREYWSRRLDRLPPPPDLPRAKEPEQVVRPTFGRRELWLAPEKWRAVRAEARRHGLTPSAVLAAAYAEVLATWSAAAELTLNVTLFDRRDVHPDIGNIVGDFTSLLLVGHHAGREQSWATTARRFQQQMWSDMQHSEVSAIWVLRRLAQRTANPMVSMPVVFTSALGMSDEFTELRFPFGEQVWGVSQTPQVWLDCQVMERGGGLSVNWDAVEELFVPGVLDAMFGAFRGVVEWLASSDWQATLAGLLPRESVERRANASAPAQPAEPLDAGTAGEPPDGPVESAIAEVWRELLDQPEPSRHDNFFALGGDSLLAMKLVEALRQRRGYELSLRQVFGAPTIAGLAAVCGGGEDQDHADVEFEEGAV